MGRLPIATLLALTMGNAHVFAEPSVEEMHFWTSGGGPAALSAVRDKVVAAMPMLGQDVIDWASEGLLGDVDALVVTESWDVALPHAVKDFTRIDGHNICMPTNMDRTEMIWTSTAAFDAIGAAFPTTREELNALAPRFREAGNIPPAHGGHARQEVDKFDATATSVDGADFYHRGLIELDDATLRGPEMVALLEELAQLRGMVDENAPGRDWNLASAMVINSEAAMQIMAGWAKGEFTNAGKLPGEYRACIPVPGAEGDTLVFLVTALSLFAQTDPDLIKDHAVPASAIMDKDLQVAFNQAKGAIPVRPDIDWSGMDGCAQATSAAMSATGAAALADATEAAT
ncbi:MAG: carbohydrate ABC transporter substrate-binding protein [Rhodobacter sp.]|nr:carbohydrate ABC transporter substrate-binding protein [Rhodobacter sp.]